MIINNSKAQSLIEKIAAVMHRNNVKRTHFDEVLLKFLCIHALNVKKQMPAGICLDESIADNKTDFNNLVGSLKKSDDAQVVAVFEGSDTLEELATPLTYSVITTLLRYSSDSIDSLAVDFLKFDVLNRNVEDCTYMNISVCEFIRDGILDIQSGESVYSHAASSLPICVVASQTSNAVFYETTHEESMRANALSIMSPNKFNISRTNFIENPGYTSSKNELQKFDCGAVLSPLGSKLRSTDNKQFDRFNKAALRSNKTEVFSTMHLLEQCTDKAVISVSESTLFGSVEKSFRQYLIDHKILSAVVSLPTGIWPGTSIKTSLLIVDPKGDNDTVRFLDLEKTNYVKKTDHRSLELFNFDKLKSYLDSTEELDCAISVSLQEIRDNDYFLQSSRYVLSQAQKKVRKLLTESDTVTLGEVAVLERGLAARTTEGDCNVLEVSAGDLNDIGDISTPTRKVQVSQNDFQKSRTGVLQPNDIILIIQGSAGRVGLVPENVGDLEDQHWMPSKTAIAIRVNSDIVDPKFLYTYLSSDIGQTQLLEITQGAAIANISLNQLRELPIILPTLKEQQKATSFVDHSREVQAKIKKLESELLDMKREFWSL